MKRKQYRRREEFRAGYRQGYRLSRISAKKLQTMSEDFKRGYYEGRRDAESGEPSMI